jgi:class 3 adenylate cyclase/tetratricopeptide (TPR) repeat protein
MAAQPGQREVRKTVTILRCDVTGSTALGEQLDPEAMRRVQSRFFEEMAAVVERHGGIVEKFIGDAVMAVFGIPTVHEDDALRAARTAVEMRERLSALNEELERERGVRLEVRTGLTTGEVVAGDAAAGQAFVTGDAANVAARLEQAAAPGEILVGEPTYRLIVAAVEVEPLAPLAVKGKAEPLTVYRLVRILPGAEPIPRRLETRMVGRDRELNELRSAYARSVEERACELVTLLGEAGIGKSRLSEELAQTLRGEASILRGRCLPYGEGITYWPLVEIVRDAGGDSRARLVRLLQDEPDAELVAARVATAVGFEEASAGTEEIFWATRKLLEALARERPVVVLIEDLQWAEPTFLDLLEHVAYLSRSAPLLLLCIARSELLETRPGWPGRRLSLEPLSAEESDELVLELGGRAVDESARARITSTAAGNPLFLEQMLAMTDGDAAELAVPPTIQALLAARLDQLGAEERKAVECAAIVGQEFWSGAVRELSRADSGRALLELVRQELIEPHDSVFAGEDAYRFGHILVRDAAYDAIPKEVRADLHERLALWLERKDEQRETRHDEIVGYHLEQAYRCREELGPLDEAGRALARRAAERLALAGKRALARDDPAAAANLLGRAVASLPPEDPARAGLLASLGAALRLTGKLEDALNAARAAIEHAEGAGDQRVRARATVAEARVRLSLNPTTVDSARAQAEEAIRVLESLGDDAGLASAWLLVGDIHNWLQEMAAMEQAHERALAHARRAGAARTEAEALSWIGLAVFMGPTPVPAAIARLEKILAEAHGPLVEAHALLNLGGLRAMNGEIELGRRQYVRADEIYRELGMRLWAAATVNVTGQIELIAGDPERAETVVRRGYEELAEMGERGYLSTAAALLARAICLQRRYEEAERFVEISEETSGVEDRMNDVLCAGVRARIAAERGELDEAQTFAKKAVATAAEGDAVWLHGEALLDLTQVLALAGRPEEPLHAARQALRLFEEKGDRVSAAKARALLESAD